MHTHVTHMHTFTYDVFLHTAGSSSEEEEEEEEDLLQRSGKLLATSVHRLPREHIEVKRLKDINASKRPPVRSHDSHATSDALT